MLSLFKSMKNQHQQPQLETKSSELYIDSGGSEGFCSSLVYEPANISEFQIGSLYVVGEIKSTSKNCSYLINSLASIIKKELYRNPKRSALDSFEISLSKANNYLGDIASQGNVDWIGKIHMACALFSQGQLYIAHTGAARILLLRNSRLTCITEDFSKNENTPFPSKTFTNITSGPLLNSDRITLATPGLFNMLSLEEIRHAISVESCTKSIENLGEISEADDDAETSSIIIVDTENFPVLAAEQNLDKSATIEECSAQSQKNIPSAIKLSLKDIIGKNTEIFSNSANTSSPIQVSKPSVYKKTLKDTKTKLLKYLYSTSRNGLNLLFKYSQKIIKFLLKISKESFKKISLWTKSIKYKIQNRHAEKSIKISSDSEFSKNLEILAGISSENSQENKMIIKINKQEKTEKDKKNKRIISLYAERIAKFSIPILVVAVGIFGTFLLKKKEVPKSDNIPAKVNAIIYQGYLQKAQQNKQDAETALIYRDEKKAQELLLEASELVKKSIRLGAASSEVKQIKNDIQAQLDQINRVTTIQNPFLICDISTSLSKNFQASSFNYSENVLQAIDTKNSQSADLDTVLYKAKNLAKISPSPYSSDIIDSDTYNGYTYFISKTQNQIFKVMSNRTTPWIKQSGIDLSSAVSISIDGSLYVLKSDGTIFKLTGGRLKNTLKISAKNPNKIYTRIEIDRLIILDPPEKKIITITKKGELVSQIKSNKFNDLKDVYIDAATNSMYVLNGNKVYRIDS